jgi:hypothetical protein
MVTMNHNNNNLPNSSLQLVLRSNKDPLELEMQPQRLIRLAVNLKRSDKRR